MLRIAQSSDIGLCLTIRVRIYYNTHSMYQSLRKLMFVLGYPKFYKKYIYDILLS